MLVRIVPILNLNYEKVQYYTVVLEGKEMSEFRDFQQRMSVNENDRVELNEIRRYIKQIGVEWGAHPKHFKHERAAERLPPPYHYIETEDPDDYGLRLYCIRLCNEIVILLNGARKTHRDPEQCPACGPHFKMANRIARKINKAIEEKMIRLDADNREIVIDDHEFELEI